ncbi:MAG: 4Fe-4S dicluster domain-containing protein [Deltaproteobacteria bacterium]|nr:4Fe-4S dicluster domain-containing protein [Deltaproteobacteria bacterium]
MEEKKNKDSLIITEELGRRDFIKKGCEIIGATMFVGLLPYRSARAEKPGNPPPHASDNPDYNWEDHLYAYVIDTRKCIGCGMCVRACRKENNVPEGFFRTWVERYEISERGEVEVDSPKGGEEGFGPLAPGFNVSKGYFVPKMCNHCSNSPCTQVCPVGASYKTEEGVVLVDPNRCVGCGYCVQACPYGSRYINPVTKVADKCTWCYHRITKGLPPACVQACPVGARMFGDVKKEDDPVRKILATERISILQAEKLTKPTCFYLGLDKEVR